MKQVGQKNFSAKELIKQPKLILKSDIKQFFFILSI